jgi:hypothetical protein
MFNVWGGGSQRAKNVRADPRAAQQRQNLDQRDSHKKRAFITGNEYEFYCSN